MYVCMACVTLASNIEEAHPLRRIRDVINVFSHIKQVRQGKLIKPVILDENYINLKNNVIKEERRVLKELGFCVHIKHPHKLVVMYMKFLEAEENSKFLQMSWNFMNDSLRTDCFVRYQPETIACACIYLSARKLNIPLPTRPCSWYGVLGVDHEDIIDCCHRIVNLYRRSKPVQEHLEKEVENLKAQLEKSRRMAEVVAKESITDSTVAKLNPEVRQQEKKEDSGKKVQDIEGRSRSREERRNVYSRDQSYSDRESRKKVSREYSPSPRQSKSRERQEYRERSPEGKRNLGDRGEKNQEEIRNFKEKYEKGDRIEREKYRR